MRLADFDLGAVLPFLFETSSDDPLDLSEMTETLLSLLILSSGLVVVVKLVVWSSLDVVKMVRKRMEGLRADGILSRRKGVEMEDLSAQ